MRLVLDLRFAGDERDAGPDGRLVTPEDLDQAVRQPRVLARLLWRRRWDCVTIRRDDLQRSAFQAGAAVIGALARARGFAIADGLAPPRPLRRSALLVTALLDASVALPRELWHTHRLLRAVRREMSASDRLPGSARSPRSVTYLRTEPAISFRGLYIGGAAAHTTGVINGLEACGLDVQVYSPERPYGINARTTLVPPRRVHHLVGWLGITAYGEEVVAKAAARDADFVYQRYSLGSFAGLQLARRLGVPLVLEFNGSEVWAERHWGRGELRLADRLVALEDANVRGASLVVVVSDILRDVLLESGAAPAERILVNPNGVNVERLAPYRGDDPAAWRARMGLPDVPTVGFVGTFGFWHGVTLLPGMIEGLSERRPDARWVLIGGGALYGDVEAEIRRRGLAHRVRLTGPVDHERALALLAACDVCVSPHVPNPDGSRFFGSPTKLFEYMGLGKPIVASSLEQIAEVLEHGRTGLLSPPGDTTAAVSAIETLLGDGELRRRLGVAALEEARTTYSWTAHVRRILEALEGTAGSDHGVTGGATRLTR
jgi:glycosyltransferase involved in cell wall biosynthesis